jgi:hypothetical protein
LIARWNSYWSKQTFSPPLSNACVDEPQKLNQPNFQIMPALESFKDFYKVCMQKSTEQEFDYEVFRVDGLGSGVPYTFITIDVLIEL